MHVEWLYFLLMEGEEINFLSKRNSAQVEILVHYNHVDKESYTASHTSWLICRLEHRWPT